MPHHDRIHLPTSITTIPLSLSFLPCPCRSFPTPRGSPGLPPDCGSQPPSGRRICCSFANLAIRSLHRTCPTSTALTQFSEKSTLTIPTCRLSLPNNRVLTSYCSRRQARRHCPYEGPFTLLDYNENAARTGLRATAAWPRCDSLQLSKRLRKIRYRALGKMTR